MFSTRLRSHSIQREGNKFLLQKWLRLVSGDLYKKQTTQNKSLARIHTFFQLRVMRSELVDLATEARGEP